MTAPPLIVFVPSPLVILRLLITSSRSLSSLRVWIVLLSKCSRRHFLRRSPCVDRLLGPSFNFGPGHHSGWNLATLYTGCSKYSPTTDQQHNHSLTVNRDVAGRSLPSLALCSIDENVGS